MPDPVRVFCGADANNCDLEQMAVFEYTLRRHCSMPLELRWMRLNNKPPSFWYVKKWGTAGFSTPFTAFRWGVAEFCGFEGKAIYCDVDQWWQRDPVILWDHPMSDGAVILNKQNEGKFGCSVMVIDCAKMKKHVSKFDKADPKFNWKMNNYFRQNNHLVDKWDSSVIDWNVLDGAHFDNIDDPRIGLVHCTKMGTQPSHEFSLPRLAKEGQKHWYDGKVGPHPREDIRKKFAKLLSEAKSAGYTLDQYRNPDKPVKFHKKSYKGK